MINVRPTHLSVEKSTVIQVGPRRPGAPEGCTELWAYIRESLAKAKSLDDLGLVLRDFVGLIGMDNFNIGFYNPGVDADQTLYIFNGYDPEWWKIYHGRRYVDFDPIMAMSVQRSRPYEWHEIDFTKAHPRSSELYAEAMRFGLMGGFSMRVIGPYGIQAYVSFSTETPGKTLGDRRDYVFSTSLLFITEFLDACLAVMEKSPGMITLTERQLQTLQLAADGLPHKTIAGHLGVVERTVDHHIKEIQRRTRRKTRSSVIALATQMGLIVRDVPLKRFQTDDVTYGDDDGADDGADEAPQT